MRVDNFVILVPFTIPGEEVEVRLDKVHKNFAFGTLIKILQSSKHRLEPRCIYFGKCGGCQLQHMTYETQLKHKQQVIQDALKRIANIDVPLFPIRGAKEPFEYRRYIRLQRRENAIGFIGIDNKTLVEIEKCVIFSEEKISLKEGENTLFKSDEHVHQIWGLTIFSSPTAFLQNHKEQSEAIYREVTNQIKEVEPNHVLDLYCGIGVTSLLLAKEGIKVTGVELSAEAIALAKKSANYNKIIGVDFLATSCEKAIEQFASSDIILVNPPRTGLDKKVIEGIKRINPKHLFYISCMSQTLARDVEALGYRVHSGQAFDMFPQTAHVETLLHLIRECE